MCSVVCRSMTIEARYAASAHGSSRIEKQAICIRRWSGEVCADRNCRVFCISFGRYLSTLFTVDVLLGLRTKHRHEADSQTGKTTEKVSWTQLGMPTHKFRQHLWNNTDFRWIFKALGDILWPYKVAKMTQEGRLKKIFFLQNVYKFFTYPQKTLVYDYGADSESQQNMHWTNVFWKLCKSKFSFPPDRVSIMNLHK
jgi:hypothetical protein